MAIDNTNTKNDRLIVNMMIYLQKTKDSSSKEYEKIIG